MSFRNVISNSRGPELDKREIQLALGQLGDGRSNAGGSFTVALSATTTTVTDSKVASDSKIALSPTDANAASEVASTYVSSKTDGSFVVTHPSNATARTFDYVIQG